MNLLKSHDREDAKVPACRSDPIPLWAVLPEVREFMYVKTQHFACKRPSSHFQRQLTAAGIAKSGYSGPKVWPLRRRRVDMESNAAGTGSIEPVPAPLINTPLHTLNERYGIRNRKRSREHLAQKSWSARRLSKAGFTSDSKRLRRDDSEKVNLCAAAAPIITCASACFALSGSSTPAAPALRMPACGERVGGKFSYRGVVSMGGP